MLGPGERTSVEVDLEGAAGHAHILLNGELSKLARAAGLWAGKYQLTTLERQFGNWF